MPKPNAKKIGILAAALAAHTLILFFYIQEARHGNAVIAQEKNKLRSETKQFESYLKENFAEGRSAESRRLLNSFPQKQNSIFEKFLKVLENDPQSLAVLSDRSRASALAAKFHESREKELEKTLAPIRARQTRAAVLSISISLILLTAMGFLVISPK